MQIEHFLNILDKIAPLKLASDWDKAGLQIEPHSSGPVHNVLITLDLTHAVLEEAVSRDVDFIIAYHPLIFDPLPGLIQSHSIASICMKCIHQGITVYSPHTALDAVSGGMTDWLASSAGNGEVSILEPCEENPEHGHGRQLLYSSPSSIQEIAENLKKNLNLTYVRTAQSPRHENSPIATAAICPGAGASMLLDVEADLLITGEMRHHDILAATAKGKSVILLEHAQSERGFLPAYLEQIKEVMGDSEIQISISEKDVGPLNLL